MKFIETSSGIQHNVDELLVGILKQVDRSPPQVFSFARSQSLFAHTDPLEGDPREEAVLVQDEKLSHALVAPHGQGDPSEDLLQPTRHHEIEKLRKSPRSLRGEMAATLVCEANREIRRRRD